MEHEGLITLCIKLLDNPEIAEKFIHDKEDNASMIYRVLYELFPCTYYLYTEIVLKLIQHEALQSEVSQNRIDLEYVVINRFFRCRKFCPTSSTTPRKPRRDITNL